jgi:hypothetical protein
MSYFDIHHEVGVKNHEMGNGSQPGKMHPLPRLRGSL